MIEALTTEQLGLIMAQSLLNFTTKEQINALEEELLKTDYFDVPVEHNFANGLYTRQVTIPAGTFAIGHDHADECINVVIAGSVSVVIDGEVRLISGPCVFISPPNSRKIGYVHSDLTWMTIHATKKTNLDDIEKEIIIKSDAFKRHEATLDFRNAIKELGFSEPEVVAISENKDDFIDKPIDGVYVAESGISGAGLFADKDFSEGDIICAARVGGKRTIAGRYTNHAKLPNAEMTISSDTPILLVTKSQIRKGEEITIDYRRAFSISRNPHLSEQIK